MLLSSSFTTTLLALFAVAHASPGTGTITPGQSISFLFPPLSAPNAASSLDSLFPDPSEVGFPGPTPTGDEAEEVATAPVALFPLHTADAFPLVPAETFDALSSTLYTTNVPGADNTSDSGFDVLRSFGNLSPVFASNFGLPDDVTERVPDGCELTQVHLLHRHGARYPTSGSQPVALAAKLLNQTVNGTGFTATGPLSFLNTWENKVRLRGFLPFIIIFYRPHGLTYYYYY